MKRILLPLTFTLLAAPALAENQEGRVLLNPALAYQKFDNGRALDEASGFGVGVEYQFGPNWAAELAGFVTEGDDIDVVTYKLDGLYYFKKDGTVQPYLGFGIGRGEFEFENDDEDETQVNAGLGVRFNFTEVFSARWDLRAVHGLPDDKTDMMTTLGVSFAFGGESAPAKKEKPVVAAASPVDSDGDGVVDSADKCPGTVPGVAVNSEGCPLDSDGDGVTDDKDQCPDTEAGAKVDEKGCVGVTKTLTVESIELHIKFPSGSDVIQEQYQPELQKVAEFLKRHTDLTVDIEGHTDSQGSAKFNKALSQRRADSVKNDLVSRYGIAADRVNAVGYGEEKPIESNDTAEGRQYNRRVVAVMQKEVMK